MSGSGLRRSCSLVCVSREGSSSAVIAHKGSTGDCSTGDCLVAANLFRVSWRRASGDVFSPPTWLSMFSGVSFGTALKCARRARWPFWGEDTDFSGAEPIPPIRFAATRRPNPRRASCYGCRTGQRRSLWPVPKKESRLRCPNISIGALHSRGVVREWALDMAPCRAACTEVPFRMTPETRSDRISSSARPAHASWRGGRWGQVAVAGGRGSDGGPAYGRGDSKP